MRRNNTKRLALCGILAAMAVAVMFLGGVLPFAAIACPMLASLVMLPVYIECGNKWGWVWFLSVAFLAGLLAPEKESAVLFAFFGYYPLIKKYLGRLPKAVKYAAKFLYLNLTVLVAYSLMLYALGLEAVAADFADIETWTLAVMLVLANISFFLYDVLIGRLEIAYHVRLRPKLKL